MSRTHPSDQTTSATDLLRLIEAGEQDEALRLLRRQAHKEKIERSKAMMRERSAQRIREQRATELANHKPDGEPLSLTLRYKDTCIACGHEMPVGSWAVRSRPIDSRNNRDIKCFHPKCFDETYPKRTLPTFGSAPDWSAA